MIRLAAFDPGAAGFAALLTESEGEGHRMLRCLAEGWTSGDNRFTAPNEALLAAWAAETLVGICGLNRDPYDAAEGAGRVRHLYVAREFRAKGVGRLLVSEIIRLARPGFDYLNTNAPQPAHAFYLRLGFVPLALPRITHRLKL